MRNMKFLLRMGTLTQNVQKQKLFHCKGMQILGRNISQTAPPSSVQASALESSVQASPMEKPVILEEDIIKNSLQNPDYFGVANMFTVEDLFKANIHLGHREGSLCNYMKPYIFGSRLGHLIIDLDQTSVMLRDALNFTAHIAFRGGIILFVCRSAQHQLLVERTAEECKEFSHTRPYQEGTLTNSTNYFGGVTRLPDLIIFISVMNDVLAQHLAVADAAKLFIPTVGIVDTNSDPRIVTYPVPGNDDSHLAIKLYCKLFKEAILRGKQKRKELLPNK